MISNHDFTIIKDLIYISQMLAFIIGVSNVTWGRNFY